MEWLLGLIGNILIQGMSWYVKKVAKDEEMIRSYYKFLEIMDAKAHQRVKDRLESESSLDRLQRRIRKRKAEDAKLAKETFEKKEKEDATTPRQ